MRTFVATALIVLTLIAAVAAAAPPRSDLPPGTDAVALQRLADELAAKWEARRGPEFIALRDADTAVRAAQRANPNLELIGMDPLGFPIYYRTDNLNAARTISTDDVWLAPLNLDGSTLASGRLGVWDGGGVRLSHQEFGGRVTQMDGSPALSDHATHVAGTMAAAGTNGNAKGMAHGVLLNAWTWSGDESEMASAAAGGMLVSNHSYGVATGFEWDGDWYWHGNPGVSPTEDYEFGFYDSNAADWDQIARNAPGYLIFKSAGNDRDDNGDNGSGHYVWAGSWVWSTAVRDRDGGATGYDTLSPKSTAKNILVVGAVNDIPGGWTNPGGVSPASFTSYGPTDDGRIKPDLVANGVNLYSPLSGSDTQYAYYSGTSMSSPSAAGSAALVTEYYAQAHGASPLAATLKALLIHTCDEAGSFDGPDYRFGWGLMNTASAVEAVDSSIFVESSLSNGAVDEYVYDPLPGQAMTVTLVWADTPGNPAPGSLDPATLMLNNDLDLRVEQDAVISEPWILDPANPAAAATTGDNVRDNVEKIEIATQTTGQVTVRVSHEGFLSAAQPYSLVITGVTEGGADWTDVTTAELAGADDTHGIAWIDMDDDGDHDIYVTNDQTTNVMLRNDAGTFVVATPVGLDDPGRGYASIFGDYDNDGDRDLYMSRDIEANRLLRNDAGTWVETTIGTLGDTGMGRAVNWVDDDLDGKLDIYVANFDGANKHYRNFGDLGGNWYFFEQSGLQTDAGAGVGASWTDVDLDGDAEPYIVNRGQANKLLDNGLTFGFYDATFGQLGDTGFGGGTAWGDYDNDGRMDLYVCNDGQADLLLRNAPGGFTNITGGALNDAGDGMGCAWGDYDNDGDLDLFVTRDAGSDLLLRNDAGAFAFVSQGFPHMSGASRSCAWADYDGDGDLDLYIGADGGNRLIRNDLDNGNHWFHMDLVGATSNTDGIGARIRLVAGGLTQYREMRAGAGYLSQPSPTIEFGLGAATMVDTVQVIWPSGSVQTAVDLHADRRMVFLEGTTVGVPAAMGELALSASPNPFNPSTTIRFEMGRAGDAVVEIFDVAGRRVRTLVSGSLPAGLQELRWNGRDEGGRDVASGVYHVIVRADGGSAHARLTLLK